MTQVARRVFRFGVFEVDPATGELRKHGVRIKLRSQPFQILVMLLERRAQIVTREELRQRLWGDGTFVDFDHGLNTAVNKLREALSDSASVPRYIETISGKGYRFIAPIETVAADPTIAQPVSAILTAPDELPAAPRKRIKTLLLLVQAMYLGFYLGALANLAEIHDIFLEANLPPGALTAILVTTAVVMIPVRLYLLAAVAFDFRELPAKFRRLFPALLALDLLWVLSPFLLIHHIPIGVAFGFSAALVYMPFAQRSLVLMYARRQG
jgi:DNA-binding winged helix-turn-helix (wHTH) protein